MSDPTGPSPSSSPDCETQHAGVADTVRPPVSPIAQTSRPAPGTITEEAPRSTAPNHNPTSETVTSALADLSHHQDGVQTIQLLQHPPEKIALEIHSPPDPPGFWNVCGRFFRALLKDPVALASLGATLAIAYVGYTINKQQVASSLAQSKAAEEQVNVTFIDEFSKRVSELVLPDNTGKENLTKKRLAAITLAQYGVRVLPALKMSLSSDDPDIREAAAVVITQMFADNTPRTDQEKSLHDTVFAKLQDYFAENNPALRIGVLECYLFMNSRLTDSEREQTRARILQHVNPAANYVNKAEEQRVLLWAVKVFSYWPSNASKDFLLAVATNATCSDEPREAAINYLSAVTKNARDLTPEQRKSVSQDVTRTLESLLPQAPERLRPNILAAIESLQKP